MIKFNEIENPQQLLDFLSEVEYKWMDKNGIFHKKIESSMYEKYSLMTPQEVIKYKCGICMDQCELERFWFKKNKYECNVLIIQVLRENEAPGHAFLIYKNNQKFYWFENAWYDQRGIHEFDSYSELIDKIKKLFIIQNNINESELTNLVIKEQPQYPYHMSYEEMDNYDNNNKIKC